MRKKMVKAYILGEARGSYRIQTFIKLLLDDRQKYKVYYDSILYSCRPVRYLKSLFLNPFIILLSDIVYVNTMNVDANIIYELIWAKLFRKKVIVDYYVSVYDTVVLDRKWFGKNSLLAKMALAVDHFFVRCGDVLFFLNKSEKDYYLRVSGIKNVSERKCCIIPVGVEKRAQVKNRFVNGESDILNICWWGSYQPLHGLEKIIKAAEIIKQKNLKVRWYFFGNDEKKCLKYKNLAEKLGLEDVCTFRNDYTFANGKLEPFLTENCDLALSIFGDSEKSKTVLPNKTLDGCAMHCLVLSGNSGGTSEYFDNTSLFLCERTAESIADKVEEIYHTDKDKLKKRIEKAYSIFEKDFSIEALMKKYQMVIESMMLSGRK